jgi:hypothetical protein
MFTDFMNDMFTNQKTVVQRTNCCLDGCPFWGGFLILPEKVGGYKEGIRR